MKLALKSSPRPQQRLSPAAVSVSGGATCVGGTRGATGSCPLRWPAPRQGETAQPGAAGGSALPGGVCDLLSSQLQSKAQSAPGLEGVSQHPGPCPSPPSAEREGTACSRSGTTLGFFFFFFFWPRAVGRCSVPRGGWARVLPV